jgi:hypothetical protein
MSSRREEKEQRRQERLAREQAEAVQAKRRRTYAIVVGTILGVAVLAAGALALTSGGGDGDGHGKTGNAASEYPNSVSPPPQSITDLDAAAEAAGCKLENPSIEGRTHVSDDTKVTYGTTPPTSGNHNPVPAEDGYYAQMPPVRNTVHTLEHGRIYIQYKPTLRKRRIDQLGGLFNEDPFHMVLAPNTQMSPRLAVTAWGHLATCRRVTDEAFDMIRAFRDRYRDRGPEAAP